jgi:hypothetical protein
MTPEDLGSPARDPPSIPVAPHRRHRQRTIPLEAAGPREENSVFIALNGHQRTLMRIPEAPARKSELV